MHRHESRGPLLNMREELGERAREGRKRERKRETREADIMIL